MATRDEVYAAIRNADKAGDADAVRALGAYLQSLPSDTEGSSAPAKAPRQGNALLDTGNAVGTGYFRGLTRLAGLPVDTVANVLDLGKAALGSGYQAITGKPAPEALQLTDRKDVVGSGDWLIDRMGRTAPGKVMLHPSNPEYEGGYAQTVGGGLTAVMNPQSAGQAAAQAVLGATSSAGGKAAYDATGNPALAVTASLLPSAGVQATGELSRKAIRGGEQGRREMAQRVQDLKEAGIDRPTLGLASGNDLIAGTENMLQSTPGAVGTMRAARERIIDALRAKSAEAAEQASPNRGTTESGAAIQKGIQGFAERFKDQQGKLYDRLGDEMGQQHPTQIGTTRETLAALNSDIPGAPNLSKFFKNKTIQQLEAAVDADVAGSPQSVQVYPQPPKAAGGVMNAPIPQPPVSVVIPEGPPTNTLPFEAVKKARTLVGSKISDSSLMDDVPRSKWKQLYGAMSEDIGNTATAAGPDAERAFNRANDYSRAGMNRLERVEPFERKTAPEQAFTAMERAARENVSTLQAVKKTLPPDARGQVAGTIIERLGRATNANQNETGDAWSPQTFLTNWNKMAPKAREELFSGFPNAPEVRGNVEAVAKAASMMREGSKMWANPSGTSANLASRGTLGAIGVGGLGALAGMVNPAIPLAAATGVGGARLLAEALTRPGLTSYALQPGGLSPADIAAALRAMNATGTGQPKSQ